MRKDNETVPNQKESAKGESGQLNLKGLFPAKIAVRKCQQAAHRQSVELAIVIPIRRAEENGVESSSSMGGLSG